MRHMVLCPGCHSIRKAGTTCELCTCPVPAVEEEMVAVRTGAAHGGTSIKLIKTSRINTLQRVQDKDIFC